MSNFKILNNITHYDLQLELDKLINDNKIFWPPKNDQICINSTKDDPDNFFFGRGSLIYDWDKSFYENGEITIPKRKTILQEKNFTELCSAFRNTHFENVFYELNTHFKIGRIRLMKSMPKTCLSWHVDNSPRLHYPIKTQEGCFMVIENEVKHLEKNTWYWTNTILPHTAFNSSKEDRIHLVAVILE